MKGYQTAMTVDHVRELHAGWLAARELGDCGSPSLEETEGIKFLESVRDAVVEWVTDGGDVTDEDACQEAAHQIADDAPDIYTYTLWREFVQVAAYNELPDLLDDGMLEGVEYGDKVASIALYTIAERLALALFEALRASAESEEDDTDESEDGE